MKNIFVTILAFLFTSQAAFAIMVGRVDMQRVLLNINEGKKVRKDLEKYYNTKQKELKSEEDKIKKMQQDFEKQAVALNEKARLKKQQDIQKALLSYQQLRNKYQEELQNKEQKAKKPIIEKVRTVIEGVSQTAGVDMTFEANTAPIMYAKQKKDLTDEVIKAYNKKHK